VWTEVIDVIVWTANKAIPCHVQRTTMLKFAGRTSESECTRRLVEVDREETPSEHRSHARALVNTRRREGMCQALPT
jgi:hypothetical protein